ncbi:MAG: GerMN domain-containing protein [Thermoleophilia bacterium]
MRPLRWFFLVVAVSGVALLAVWGSVSLHDTKPSAQPTIAAMSPAATAAKSPATSVSPSSSPILTRTLAVSIYFMRGEFIGTAHRAIPWTTAPATAALKALLAGPSAREKAAGLSTTIPGGTKLLGLTIKNGIATVDLSGQYPAGGGTLSETARLAQVVYTLTQFPSVTGVNFRIDGQSVTVFSGEGVLLTRPQQRADYESLTPTIFVDTPAVSDTVTSPLVLQGTVDTQKVFEAQFAAKLVTSGGKTLITKGVIATVGSTVRRPFGATLTFASGAGGASRTGTLVVFDPSPKDGQPLYVVKIPLTFK